MASILSYLYGTLLIVGGAMGAAKSPTSLYAGAGSGAAIILLEYFGGRTSEIVQVVVAAALTGVMGTRFNESGKFMPAGLVAGLSAAAVLGYGNRTFFGSGGKAHQG